MWIRWLALANRKGEKLTNVVNDPLTFHPIVIITTEHMIKQKHFDVASSILLMMH